MSVEELDAHRQSRRAYNTKYYADHSDKFRADAKQYRKEHLEQVRNKEREYYIANPEILLLKCAKQRARKENLPWGITAEDIRKVIPLDGCCPITLVPFKRGVRKVGPTSMTLDRIIPALGYVPGNIAVISHLANTIKQDCTDPEVFIRLANYLKEGRCH
jgi:hypothetical protein